MASWLHRDRSKYHATPLGRRGVTGRPSRPDAFTLIELLVVISIIALLIALLLPALGQARQVMYAARCMSNQRQLVMGIYNYTTDHEGVFLPPFDTTTYEAGWNGILDRMGYVPAADPPNVPYYKSAVGPFECPGFLATDLGYNALLQQEAGSLFVVGTHEWLVTWYGTHFGYNWYHLTDTGNIKGKAGHLTRARRPGDLYLVGDFTGGRHRSIRFNTSPFAPTINLRTNAFHFRHAGRTHIGYLDGHVAATTHSQTAIEGSPLYDSDTVKARNLYWYGN